MTKTKKKTDKPKFSLWRASKPRILVLVVVVLACSAVGYRHIQASHALSQARNRVIWIATTQIGQTEFNSRVLQYTQGRREAWCADFISWVYWQAGYRFKGGLSDWRIPLVYERYPGVHNLRDYLSYTQRYKKKETGYHGKPGDIVLLTRNGASHAGIIVETSTAGMKTIEGNVWGWPGAGPTVAAGDKVGNNLYTWNDARIDGYGTWLDQFYSGGRLF